MTDNPEPPFTPDELRFHASPVAEQVTAFLDDPSKGVRVERPAPRKQSPAEILSAWDQEDANMKDHLTGAGVIAPDWWQKVPTKRVPGEDEAARKAEIVAAASDEIPLPAPTIDVRVYQLHVLPHPNADALELAVVGGVASECKCGNEGDEQHEEIIGGFRAIVPKGQYTTGDYAIYIPEAAMLPDALIEELGLVGRLAGPGKNRVKAIRLRGELSQGIVCRPAVLSFLFKDLGFKAPEVIEEMYAENYADALGIIKWSPRVPAAFAGKIRERGDSMILGWTDIPNIKREMRLFKEGELIRATEKIHGTCCLVTFDVEGDQLLVSSKGIAKRGWDLVEEPGNVYWRAVREHRMEPVLRWVASLYPEVKRVGLYGEVYGHGIQDLTYDGLPGVVMFMAFDLRLDDMWLSPATFDTLLSEAGHATGVFLDRVPVVYEGQYDYERLCALAEGESHATPGFSGQIKEGLVVRALSEIPGQHRLAKFINPAYLLRKGDTTEFE